MTLSSTARTALLRSNDWIIPSLESNYIRPHTLPLLGRFQQRRFSNVVVCASADCADCLRLLDSFVHFLREQRVVDRKKLFLLKGGIEAFLKKKPSLVVSRFWGWGRKRVRVVVIIIITTYNFSKYQ